MEDMEETTCLLIGGAKHAKFFPGCKLEKHHRMIQSLQHDFENIIKFAAEKACKKSTPNGTQIHLPMKIRRILLNRDLFIDDADILKEIKDEHEDDQEYQRLIKDAPLVKYRSKARVRREVRRFLKKSPTKHLFLFMAGHGDQEKPSRGPVRESFLLPTAKGGDKKKKCYYDYELSKDIQKLPKGKRLYIVIHSCHSGGMVNRWQIKTDDKDFALFASADADILAHWNTDEEEHGYIESFCRHAIPGDALNDIADRIQKDCTDVAKRKRPDFKLSNESFGNALFGIVDNEDEENEEDEDDDEEEEEEDEEEDEEDEDDDDEEEEEEEEDDEEEEDEEEEDEIEKNEAED